MIRQLCGCVGDNVCSACRTHARAHRLLLYALDVRGLGVTDFARQPRHGVYWRFKRGESIGLATLARLFDDLGYDLVLHLRPRLEPDKPQ